MRSRQLRNHLSDVILRQRTISSCDCARINEKVMHNRNPGNALHIRQTTSCKHRFVSHDSTADNGKVAGTCVGREADWLKWEAALRSSGSQPASLDALTHQLRLGLFGCTESTPSPGQHESLPATVAAKYLHDLPMECSLLPQPFNRLQSFEPTSSIATSASLLFCGSDDIRSVSSLSDSSRFASTGNLEAAISDTLCEDRLTRSASKRGSDSAVWRQETGVSLRSDTSDTCHAGKQRYGMSAASWQRPYISNNRTCGRLAPPTSPFVAQRRRLGGQPVNGCSGMQHASRTDQEPFPPPQVFGNLMPELVNKALPQVEHPNGSTVCIQLSTAMPRLSLAGCSVGVQPIKCSFTSAIKVVQKCTPTLDQISLECAILGLQRKATRKGSERANPTNTAALSACQESLLCSRHAAAVIANGESSDRSCLSSDSPSPLGHAASPSHYETNRLSVISMTAGSSCGRQGWSSVSAGTAADEAITSFSSCCSGSCTPVLSQCERLCRPQPILKTVSMDALQRLSPAASPVADMGGGNAFSRVSASLEPSAMWHNMVQPGKVLGAFSAPGLSAMSADTRWQSSSWQHPAFTAASATWYGQGALQGRYSHQIHQMVPHLPATELAHGISQGLNSLYHGELQKYSRAVPGEVMGRRPPLPPRPLTIPHPKSSLIPNLNSNSGPQQQHEQLLLQARDLLAVAAAARRKPAGTHAISADQAAESPFMPAVTTGSHSQNDIPSLRAEPRATIHASPRSANSLMSRKPPALSYKEHKRLNEKGLDTASDSWHSRQYADMATIERHGTSAAPAPRLALPAGTSGKYLEAGSALEATSWRSSAGAADRNSGGSGGALSNASNPAAETAVDELQPTRTFDQSLPGPTLDQSLAEFLSASRDKKRAKIGGEQTRSTFCDTHQTGTVIQAEASPPSGSDVKGCGGINTSRGNVHEGSTAGGQSSVDAMPHTLKSDDRHSGSNVGIGVEHTKLLVSKSYDQVLCLTKAMVADLLPTPSICPAIWDGSCQIEIELLDPHGTVWPVTFRYVPSRYSYEFRAGWRAVALAWGLSVGDSVTLRRATSSRHHLQLKVEYKTGGQPSSKPRSRLQSVPRGTGPRGTGASWTALKVPGGRRIGGKMRQSSAEAVTMVRDGMAPLLHAVAAAEGCGDS